MSDLITDEIVEAGVRGWVELAKLAAPEWMDVGVFVDDATSDVVRGILEAAAPLIAARVLEGAADDIALAPALPGESAVSISNAETAAEAWLRKRAKEGRA